jgi:eukaryotic-like serine/threonine-protein kinase
LKTVCTVCERVSSDGNQWCRTPTCPAGTLTVVFDHGEMLSDIKILRVIRILRTSTVYEAQRVREKILLKVAHEGAQDQLKREATFLAQFKDQHPMLPVLLSPYPSATADQRPYGKTMFLDQTKYYEVFEFVDGEFLRDILLRNAQPWYQHAAWMIVSMADALAFMHVKGGKYHLNISPESVLVRTDRDGIPRPLLMDLGMVTEPQAVQPNWATHYMHPAYIPPEVLERSAIGPTADVYGLGLLFYEMLAGHPAFKFKLRSDEDVRQAVRRTVPEPLNRTDLTEDIVAIVHQAIDKVATRRQPDIRTFAKALRVKFGEVPAERTGPAVNRRLVAAGVFLLFAVLSLAGLAAILGVISPAG